jgi:hypothetical protein
MKDKVKFLHLYAERSRSTSSKQSRSALTEQRLSIECSQNASYR